ncbi:hypothetical protein TEA_012715 [Camellia sinensis var. sinensis]|uniref:Uncharacterized protein n=1 Tax=Camellia sinensis var. sinensis TaxID=542762 RepID=A0A4S4DYT0_CAMSN|nr:hypothetical protein TEA_012715 [Camellia sinensis var. sinensis]
MMVGFVLHPPQPSGRLSSTFTGSDSCSKFKNSSASKLGGLCGARLLELLNDPNTVNDCRCSRRNSVPAPPVTHLSSPEENDDERPANGSSHRGRHSIPREYTGCKVSATNRLQGRIPAVVLAQDNGGHTTTITRSAFRKYLVTTERKQIQAIFNTVQLPFFYSTSFPLQIRISSGCSTVLESGTILPIKIHRDEESGKILNLVFVWVDEGLELNVEVSVVFKEEDVCPGLKKGEKFSGLNWGNFLVLTEFSLVLSKSQSLKMLHERHLYRVFSADEDPEFDSTYSEEQRVIEAKIRMRQQELQDEELKMLTRQEISSSSRSMLPGEVGYSTGEVDEEIVSSQEPLRQSLRPRQNRDDEFDLDLEDVMIMEAIWLSIQESGRHRNSTYGDSIPSEQHMTEDQCETAMPQLAESSSSPSGGLACAIAALAERQQTSGESSGNYDANMSTFNALPSYSQFSNRGEQETECYHPDSQPAITRYEGEWGVDHGSEVAEVGTSSGRSDTAEDGGRIAAFPPQHEIEGGFQTVGGPPIIPESFEEQMMLAMAVSLAEARARTSAPGLAWQ